MAAGGSLKRPDAKRHLATSRSGRAERAVLMRLLVSSDHAQGTGQGLPQHKPGDQRSTGRSVLTSRLFLCLKTWCSLLLSHFTNLLHFLHDSLSLKFQRIHVITARIEVTQTVSRKTGLSSGEQPPSPRPSSWGHFSICSTVGSRSAEME